MASSSRRTVFERHPRLTIAALAVVFALVTDVLFAHVYFAIKAARAAARRTGPRPGPRASPPAPPFRIKTDVFHHGREPFWNTTNHWGPREYPFVTNALGFVDREPRMVSPAAGGPRLVFIGDSFTEGSGVSYEDTFVGRIDTELGRQGIQVLNAAAVSYSPIIYYRKMRYYIRHGFTLSELVVFLDISDVQDEVMYTFDAEENVVWDEARKAVEDEANRRHGGEPQPDPLKFTAVGRVLADHTLAAAQAYRLLSRLAYGDPYGSPIGRRRGLWTVDDRFFAEYGREGLRNAEVHMDQLLQLCREEGVRLTVAVYPWPDQIVRADLDSRQARFWRAWAQARNVDFLDYFPEFINKTPPRQVLERYFIPEDIHWNEAGHRLVADFFLEHYRQRRP
jgi:hypothetical protein